MIRKPYDLDRERELRELEDRFGDLAYDHGLAERCIKLAAFGLPEDEELENRAVHVITLAVRIAEALGLSTAQSAVVQGLIVDELDWSADLAEAIRRRDQAREDAVRDARADYERRRAAYFRRKRQGS